MEISRQKLETKDLHRWVVDTAALLETAVDLLDDLNTFPVPNFNTGTNLAASWSRLVPLVKSLSPGLHPGQFMAHLANESGRYPRGSSGIFLSAFFVACAKTWRDFPIIRPAELVRAAETVEQNFQKLNGGVSLNYGLTSLAQNINQALSQLEVYTLSQVIDTAVVCAQELTVDSADAHRGVGDAGLAGACLILASLADVVAEIEGEIPGNVEVVRSMLSDWANRSRTVTQTSSKSTSSNDEFEVTFQQLGFAPDLENRRQELAATCSEVLITGTVDELGFSSFTTHVHTAVPLSTLPHPHEGILIERLSRTQKDTVAITSEDPVPELDNVVLLSRAKERVQAWRKPQLLVLSEASALIEVYARSGATVLLNPRNLDDLYWALDGHSDLTVVIPSSLYGKALAEKLATHETERVIVSASSTDELTAAWLCAGITSWEYNGTPAEGKALVQQEIHRVLENIRVECMSEDLAWQFDQLCAFSPAEITEVMALIGAEQAAQDRVNLQSMAEIDPRIELTIFYGGQKSPTLLGVRFQSDDGA